MAAGDYAACEAFLTATRWFTRGLDSGDLDDCDAFRAVSL